MVERDFFIFEHDVKFEKESQVAEHIELLNSFKPINHVGDICVTQLKVNFDKTNDSTLPFLFQKLLKNLLKKEYQNSLYQD